jgi:hypothetical protein
VWIQCLCMFVNVGSFLKCEIFEKNCVPSIFSSRLPHLTTPSSRPPSPNSPLHLYPHHSTVTDTRTPADSYWATNLTRFSVSIKSSNKHSNAFKYVLVLTQHLLLLSIYVFSTSSICLITESCFVAPLQFLLPHSF